MSIIGKFISRLIIGALFLVAPAHGEVLLQNAPADIKAARHLRAGVIIHASDLLIDDNINQTAKQLIADIIGMEAKRNIYAGKVISLRDIGPPTAVARNAIVRLEFARGPLLITTEGRALDAGAVGDTVRIMNLSSKIILSATVVSQNKVTTK